jgi:phage-related protein (TIGR01555 family)
MAEKRNGGARRALNRMAMDAPLPPPRFAPPELPLGVVPEGRVSGVAMDYSPLAYDYLGSMTTGFAPFPGYPHLANLTTRGEYRQLASTMATELTREWIALSSTDDEADDKTNPRIAELTKAIERFKLKGLFQLAATHDCFFGRGQIFINLSGQDRKVPLVLSPATIPVGSLKSFTTVEAMWTTPSAYNALDPAAPDFYRPTNWFMLGQEVHASRLLTIITRPLPDMLKPAYNFSGMSLSQIAEPYVENWLRTRQAVSDLINNFSTSVLATSMDQVLQGNDDGQDVFARADLFTATRSNKGLMLLDKDREELIQVNTPLGGLHELQAQAQEHMCSISRTPAIILTGISPSGLNASSDGEIRVFYDWISAIQEAYYLEPLTTCIKVIMLHLWGEIDDSICIKFRPLWQMTPQEESAIRLSDAQADAIYLDRSVVDQEEVREKLARDPASGWDGLDTSVVVMPDAEPEPDDGEDRPAESQAELATSAPTLNGAQVSSMIEVSQAVAVGTLAHEAGLAILQQAFGLTPEAAATLLTTPPQASELVPDKVNAKV